MSPKRIPRCGKWLPEDPDVLREWLDNLIHEVETAKTRGSAPPLHHVISEFKALIEGDTEIFMLFHQMFDEVPTKPPYDEDPTGKPQVRDYQLMLELFNCIMTRAPKFNDSGLVGFPINAILDWPMGTPSGFSAFLHDKVNEQFRNMLDAWARFLRSPYSANVLVSNEDWGWFCPAAMAKMKDFDEEYICDPSAEHHGFKSWDDFFTRQFRDGRRPVASPDDDNIIVNACESAPYALKHKVKAVDQFWLKGQPYSLTHMLAGDAFAPQFESGTVYQAFLSAFSYHRWHSPVNGTIVKAYVVPGTYYSQSRAAGFDAAAPDQSQGYITQVATRAIMFIEADNPKIGLMCFIAVGMAEVSTCDMTVHECQKVKKGDEIGMFHFGGSTHCLLFRPGVNVTFDTHGQVPGHDAENIPINSVIASVT